MHVIERFRKECFLTQAEFAKKLRISQSYVARIESGSSEVSPRLCARIEVFTKGRILASDLRPDIFGQLEGKQKGQAVAG